MQEEKALATIAPERLDGLAKAQEAQVSRLTQLCGQMAQLVFTLEARLATLEGSLKTRVTVTYAQSRALATAAQARATALCEAHDLPEALAGKTIRAALWREFCKEYGIRNRADLPALYYEQALAYVDTWNSFATLRRVRERIGR